MMKKKSSNTITKVFRFRLEPTKSQRALLERIAGSCRFVNNHSLSLVKEAFPNDTILSYEDLSNESTKLRVKLKFFFANCCEKCNNLRMKTLNTFIQDLLSQGKNFFSKQEALLSTGISEIQFRHQAYRLSQKKLIKRLLGDFFMIIPAEYQALGSLPPHWIVDALMRHFGRTYYIGLLSAAALYGATNQQPMTFQVIVDRSMRTIKLSRGTINFYVKHNPELSAIDSISTPVGYVHISTKEQTIADLVKYYNASGGLSNVALIIKDLGTECNPLAFGKVVSQEKRNAMLQRLGYLLELTDHHKLANIVEQELSKRSLHFAPLRPDTPERSGKRLTRWKLILNDYVELS